MTADGSDGSTDRVAGEVALVVGLGNPGPSYAGNRHNVGFMVVDELARRAGGRLTSHKAGADVLETRLAGRRVVLARPRSFMNVSGPAVAATARYFTIPPADVVVVHDDLDLDHGVLRLKRGGGEGGHNGLRSVSGCLGSRDYLRVRFGIGRPPGRMDPADFVLRDFSAEQRRELDLLVDRCADAVEQLLTQGLAATQNQLH
ncbi:MAG: aminoacyl-tRNA hydrolase [Pseudonocardiales bacterium]|nr:aminoacyl-tRNA hydrolase [Pseudonocardiales bacterium]MBV9029862.1 aminoacyl-tRNA hydrolase [Pseudonocardiales bacterium]MBW0009655.1 aminoacyl-tRNA hydrolase [Pseudonocardiales bacterium]